ncbi:MAG: DUF302 domain-containing protein [Sulfuricurvum sp.]
MKKILMACLLSLSLWANDSSVFEASYKTPIDKVLKNILTQFEKDGLVVAWQLDILEEFKQKGLDKKFGAEFNKNNLSSVKTLVACNGKFGNDIMNADPAMMAYCPIRVTLTEKDGVTTVLYVRPSSAPKSTPAYEALKALESKVTKSIEDSMEME